MRSAKQAFMCDSYFGNRWKYTQLSLNTPSVEHEQLEGNDLSSFVVQNCTAVPLLCKQS